ncbi:MAG: hypothetical protein JWM36_1796 [Hyphomicrobiales bacterium]|nr:hypothetical protein [Hyphomicrobiales bacterium]
MLHGEVSLHGEVWLRAQPEEPRVAAAPRGEPGPRAQPEELRAAAARRRERGLLVERGPRVRQVALHVAGELRAGRELPAEQELRAGQERPSGQGPRGLPAHFRVHGAVLRYRRPARARTEPAPRRVRPDRRRPACWSRGPESGPRPWCPQAADDVSGKNAGSLSSFSIHLTNCRRGVDPATAPCSNKLEQGCMSPIALLNCGSKRMVPRHFGARNGSRDARRARAGASKIWNGA